MIIISLLSFWISTSSIYNVQFQTVSGDTVSMSQYEGKKILLVNIATGSSKVNQLGELQQIKQQYGDSLVIIGFPSNSFAKESRNNAEILQFCQNNYGVNFLLAAKNPVSGFGVQPIFSWLSNITQNGVMNNEVLGDFQKFLINESGMLVGVFAPSVSPLSGQLTGLLAN